MVKYKVTWEIDIDAIDPFDAAELALQIHRDRECIATVFTVEDVKSKDKFIVDLTLNEITNGL